MRWLNEGRTDLPKGHHVLGSCRGSTNDILIATSEQMMLGWRAKYSIMTRGRREYYHPT
ncbi:hypothetical protein [Xenorhabdus griffiniae]|uniref:hypothetical protein n=1 Tax=Xenorhabdus griffiniae TaxID=351672 RepID=UPI00235893DD|nr:hypothetical protein [Xenorhabdus griffiniae]MDC9604170.1 hypothetical protein [Xenorhabdus griffiniae]